MSGRLTSPKGDADLQGYNPIVADGRQLRNYGVGKENMMKKLIARMLVVAFAVSFASIAYATTNTTISCLTTNTEPVHTIKREFNYMDAGIEGENILTQLLDNAQLTINGIPLNIENCVVGSNKLVSVQQNGNGTGHGNYLAELGIGVAFEEIGGVITPKATTYTKTEESDNSISTDVYITVTITYEAGSMQHGGQTVSYLELISVAASYRSTSVQLSLTHKNVRGRYIGYNLNTSQFVNYTSPWYEATSCSINGVPLEDTRDGISCGLYGDARVTVTRGNQTWIVEYTVFHTGY